jgi:ATP-binding cassette subfamily F protein uup
MTGLEAEVAGLNQRLAAPDFFTKDPDGFACTAARLEEAKAELEQAESRWLDLETLREALEAGGID